MLNNIVCANLMEFSFDEILPIAKSIASLSKLYFPTLFYYYLCHIQYMFDLEVFGLCHWNSYYYPIFYG